MLKKCCCSFLANPSKQNGATAHETMKRRGLLAGLACFHICDEQAEYGTWACLPDSLLSPLCEQVGRQVKRN
jgi:hypothetical protein